MSALEIQTSYCTLKVSSNVHKVCLGCSRKGSFGNNPSRWQIHFGMILPPCSCANVDITMGIFFHYRQWEHGQLGTILSRTSCSFLEIDVFSFFYAHWSEF